MYFTDRTLISEEEAIIDSEEEKSHDSGEDTT